MASSATKETPGRGTTFARHGRHARGTNPPAARLHREFSGDVMAVDAYLQYAEQCVALAARSSSPAEKARLLQMAQAWRALAAKHENGKREDPDSGE